MADEEHRTPNAVATEELELVPEKRMAGDVDQGFGRVFRERPETRGQPPRQNDRRHELRRLVHHPSALGDDARPVEVEVKPGFLQSLLPHRPAEARLVLSVEHQEAAASGPIACRPPRRWPSRAVPSII